MRKLKTRILMNGFDGDISEKSNNAHNERHSIELSRRKPDNSSQ
jgi:hypothetical protein